MHGSGFRREHACEILGGAGTARDLVGGPPAHNAQVARDVFAGERGPVRDIVLLNAAAALLAFDGPLLDEPVVPQVAAALDRVTTAVDTGAATALLDRWAALTRQAVGAA